MAEEEMRKIRAKAARNQAEIVSSGAPPSLEIERGKQEAEAAMAELRKGIAEYEPESEPGPFDEGEHFGRVTDVISLAPMNFSELEIVRAEGIANREKSRVMKEALVNKLGERYAEKILDPEYTRALERLQTFLENGIDDMPEVVLFDAYGLTVENLIAIHETLGSPEAITRLVKALDLKREASDLEYENREPIIQPAKANFEMESGELESDITLAHWYEDGSHIVRGFSHKPVEQEDGTVTAVRSVKHDIFNLNPELGKSGIAKHVLKNSLDWYLDQNATRPEKPIADIKLDANIDVGGYAWASYGFGWDEEKMTRERVNDYIASCKKRVEQIASHTRSAGLDEEEERAIMAMLAAYDAALEKPDVTPQELALIGKDGPLFRLDSSRNWHTERQFAEAKAEASEEFPFPLHAGKHGMLGKEHRWDGKVELTQNGNQGGKNLTLLQKRVS